MLVGDLTEQRDGFRAETAGEDLDHRELRLGFRLTVVPMADDVRRQRAKRGLRSYAVGNAVDQVRAIDLHGDIPGTADFPEHRGAGDDGRSTQANNLDVFRTEILHSLDGLDAERRIRRPDGAGNRRGRGEDADIGEAGMVVGEVQAKVGVYAFRPEPHSQTELAAVLRLQLRPLRHLEVRSTQRGNAVEQIAIGKLRRADDRHLVGTVDQ
ncbi:hypothetical protein D9M69_398690 [compost metagenome]